MKLRPLATTVLLAGLPAILAQARAGDDEHHRARLIEFRVPGETTAVAPQCATLCGTQALANNDDGTVIGFYTDDNVVPHGFIRKHNGHITSFDAPGAGLGALLNQGTFPYSINNRGVIAGQYQAPDFSFHAFIRWGDESFTTFDAKDAGKQPGQGTLAFSINIKGDTAGIYIDAQGSIHGFVRRHGVVEEFDPPGAVFTMVCEETCLNSDGTATGGYVDANGFHGFVRYRDGTVKTFDAPGAVQGTAPASITDEGEIAGYLVDGIGAAHGFIRHRDGTFAKPIDVPKAFNGVNGGTVVFSINAAGATTGDFSDAALVNHGFERSRHGRFAYFDAPGAGQGAFQGTRPSTNNASGEVAGWWVDDSGLNHGFVWEPGDQDDDEAQH